MSEPITYNTDNGVKPRYDGAGSAFGALHRDLGPGFLMFDIDRMSATVETDLEMRNENNVFVEYRLGETISFVAVFEYKRNRSQYTIDALNPNSANSRARIELARRLGSRLFIVFADNGSPPFYFHEINLETGENVRMPALWYTKDEDKEKVKSFWRDVLKINK